MKNLRMWVAALGIGVPLLLFGLAMTTGLDFLSNGSISGRVTYNGVPLDRGFVLFYPTDSKSNDWAVGPIQADGTYYIASKWRHNSGQSRFRICIVPRKSQPATHVELSGKGRERHVVPVAINAKDSDSHHLVSVDLNFPARFTNVATSGLQITMGREPLEIDIDLKD